MSQTVPYTPPPYSATDAPTLFQLATASNYRLTGVPALPGGWSAVQFYSSPSGVQFITAFGYLQADPNNLVGLVIFGFPWALFLQNYVTLDHTFNVLPTGLLPDSPTAMVDDQFSWLYLQLRTKLWQQVLYMQSQVSQFQTTMPIITIGYGPAAPFAQLAALDLLPGQIYVPGQGIKYTSPGISMTSYAFSAPAFGNTSYATGYSTAVPRGYVVNLQTSAGDPVDLFPQTLAITQMVVAGSPQGPSTAIPVPVCPWLEHEPCVYGNALNGTTCSATTAAPALEQEFTRRVLPVMEQAVTPRELSGIPNPPSGYSAARAYALSLLCSCVYQAYEHPALPSNVPLPYSPGPTLSVNGVIWAATFMSASTLAVVFRGPVTWEECITLWGDNGLIATPAWLTTPNSGEVLQSYDNIYEALRPALRSLLGQVGTNTQVYFAGHGGGGPLASMALWDLSLNPTGQAVAAAVYTFGAAPVGNQAFQVAFNSACGNKSYQIVRPNDIIPQLALVVTGAFFTLGQQLTLPGGATDPRNGFSSHSIVLYQSLLNPATLSAPEAVSEVVNAAYQACLLKAGIPWNEVNKCALNSAENNGNITLSWSKAESYVPASRYLADDTACIPLQDVVVQPGHTLTLRSPHGQSLSVVMRSLQLGSGAVVDVQTNTTLRVGHVAAAATDPQQVLQEPTVFTFKGTNGYSGQDGPAGSNGPNGGPNAAGGNGGYGGMASSGGDGGRGFGGSLHFEFLTGTLRILIQGGDGGKGGNGGNGGAAGGGRLSAGGRGGDAGSGGSGGNGGDGGTVVMTYGRIGPDVKILLDTSGAHGGQGGTGGVGGAPGRGDSPSPSGKNGVAGTPGRQGATGIFLPQLSQSATPAGKPATSG